MLIQFRVENHRSLRDEQILSLAAAGDKAGSHVLRVDGLSEAIVPVAAIYGANASGKSNVLGALSFLQRAVMDSQTRWDVDGTPQDPFRLSSKATAPSLYEVEIVVDGVRVRYGFQLSAARVEEEWLFTWPNGRKVMWFEREGDRFEFGKTLHGENEVIRHLTRPNSLFLSAAAQSNHAALLPIFRYFSAWQFSAARAAGRYPHGAVSMDVARRLASDADAPDRDAILQLLQDADTGIVDVRVEANGASVLRGDPSLRLDRALRALPAVQVSFRHRTSETAYGWLPVELESSGTLTLLGLAPHILDALRDGGLLCVDELEASLHPSLALRVVKMFNDAVLNPHRAQLVFATHDTNLLGTILGEPALRRDQVWFTEKDDAGATRLYPLTDFHPRKEENLERGYLQGRYGAVPFLGELVTKADEEP